jgi:peroxiredoxin
VPRFSQLAPEFKAQGIDEIICISVNDAFVMNEWKQTQNAGELSVVMARPFNRR